MKLTDFTDYSLRVLIYLAARPSRRTTIAEIAGAFDVSEHHLTKVVHFLGKQGWLATSRGKGGGLLLARPPGDISIGSVVGLYVSKGIGNLRRTVHALLGRHPHVTAYRLGGHGGGGWGATIVDLSAPEN